MESSKGVFRDSHVMGKVLHPGWFPNSSPKVTSGSFAFESANITALQVYHATGVVFASGGKGGCGGGGVWFLVVFVCCLLYVVFCCVVVVLLLLVVVVVVVGCCCGLFLAPIARKRAQILW